MIKNVKIDLETHRKLSVKAAELQEQKGILCAVLVRAALEKISDEELKNLLEQYITTTDCQQR